ncbi:MAG: conserved repeat domain protein, partial [Acidobacteria bacterium]|nr:conserved repeat domain protein [Acidobacteriota bacterium]
MTNRCAGLRLLLAIALFVTLGAAAQESALPTEARISVVKTASPDPATAGANVTYTITASNEGPADAVNMTVTDPLPASTTFVSIA